MLSKHPAVLVVAAAAATLLALPTNVLAGAEEKAVPFHSEISWYRLDQVPVPEGRCTAPLPEGISYLWLSKEYGTHTSTHLGTGPYYIDFCVFGQLTDEGAPPPSNGIPMGYNGISQVWTAANGDQLKATGALIAYQFEPVFFFTDSVIFVGGTGRFAHVQGQGTGFIYPDPGDQTGREVYDAWIWYKR